MTSTILDLSGNQRHLVVPDTAVSAWTVHVGVAPNGDDAMSVSATTLDDVAHFGGTEFDPTAYGQPLVPSGSGTTITGWTLEVFFEVGPSGAIRTIASMRSDATATTTTNRMFWAGMLADNTFRCTIYRTDAGIFLETISPVLLQGWHLIHVEQTMGSTRQMRLYVDTVLVSTVSPVANTINTGAGANHPLYVGASRTNATEEMLDNIAHLVFHRSRFLTAREKLVRFRALSAT